MAYLISIFLLVIPWIFIPIPEVSNQLRLPKAFFFDFLCLGIICWGICYGLKFTYKNKYLSWLSLWVFVTMIFNWYIPFLVGSGGSPRFNVWCIDSYIHYLLALITSWICMSYLEKKDFITIAKYACLSSVLVTIFAFLQIVGFDPLKKLVYYNPGETNHFSALIDHPDMVGNYLAMSLPLFFMFKEMKYRVGMVIVAVGIILSKSSLSILALFLASLIYVFLRYRSKKVNIFCISALLIFLIVVLNFPQFNKFNTGFTGRITMWGEIINHIKDNPLFGLGAGVTKMFNISFGQFCVKGEFGCRPLYWVFAHNDYLEMTIQFGLLGLFLLFLVIINSIKNFNFSKDNYVGMSFLCSFIAFLLIMFGSFPMETAPCALTGLIGWWGTEKIT